MGCRARPPSRSSVLVAPAPPASGKRSTTAGAAWRAAGADGRRLRPRLPRHWPPRPAPRGWRRRPSGLAVGELDGDAGDGARAVSGPPCDVAVALADRARLARRAGEGHIVATATLAGLASLTPPERARRPRLGAGRAAAHRVRPGSSTAWRSPGPPTARRRPPCPLPAVLGLEPEFPFVGRADGLGLARRGLAAGRRRRAPRRARGRRRRDAASPGWSPS